MAQEQEEKIMKETLNHRELGLMDLKVGEQGVVSRINTRDRKTLNKLMALGILPGMKVKMLQKYPSYIFKVGNTQIAADDTVIKSISVVRST